MSVTVVADDLEICVDCTMLVANDEGTDTQRAAINAVWPTERLVLTCGEECDGWFSWSSCDGCGSTLGGDRHPAVAFDN